ncbi:hypothetical protein QQX98_011163 [Neonectria punicea]|uniref:Homeobox domain-containing protein n=1 Tax=Neonectria punicea TaxID=979145 RepID=A0ABR1GMZ9_9HYPO
MTSRDLFSQDTDLDFNAENPFEDLGFLSGSYVLGDTLFDSGDPVAAGVNDVSWFADEISAIDFSNRDGQGHSIEGFQQSVPQSEPLASSAPSSLIHSSTIFTTTSDTNHVPIQSRTEPHFPAETGTSQTTPAVKSGIRFNKEAVRILKHWLSTHSGHPYPSEAERRTLQGQTGLNRTQIANWLANARRRGKIPVSRGASSHQSSSPNPIDIPRRPGTPAVNAGPPQMNPLERWVDSPPENEPASASAIARAMASPSRVSPNFIHTERTAPLPFEGSRAPAETPRSAFELIKLELAYFMQNQFDKNARMPTKEEMQLEACRIMLASETAYRQDANQLETPTPFSWLHDLIMSDDEIVQKAKLSPIRSPAESRLYSLKINGKNSLFEECPFEAQLHDFVQSRHLSGLTITQNELKEETCYIIGRIEEVSTTPSDFIANWLVKLIHSSQDWLSRFRQRAGISVVGEFENQECNVDVSIRDYTNLERGMAKYLDTQRTIGIEPTDQDLRHQARIIIYQSDVGCNHTAADDSYWLSTFKQRHLPESSLLDLSIETSKLQAPVPMSLYPLSVNPTVSNHSSPQGMTESEDQHSILEARSLVMTAGSFFTSDSNFYRWITEELGRWVSATMSPHNPACHVPTDEEIQHYARWITYNDDDPLNQTIAENQDWLEGFKRDMRILNEASLNSLADNQQPSLS